MCWQGPYEIVKGLGHVDYEVIRVVHKKKKQIHHVNLLKLWKERECLLVTPLPEKEEVSHDTERNDGTAQSEDLVILGGQLSEGQVEQLKRLVKNFTDVFSEAPRRARGTEHNILTLEGKIMREEWHRILYHNHQLIKEDLNRILQQGVITISCSPWQSFLVADPKLNGTIWLCMDFRKLNFATHFDDISVPQIGDLLEWIGRAKFIYTFNLANGYLQIPLRADDQAKTVYGALWGLYELKRMPFGLNRAAATFQQLVDWILTPHQDYMAAYIDDIVVYTEEWEQHIRAVRAVLQEF